MLQTGKHRSPQFILEFKYNNGWKSGFKKHTWTIPKYTFLFWKTAESRLQGKKRRQYTGFLIGKKWNDCPINRTSCSRINVTNLIITAIPLGRFRHQRQPNGVCVCACVCVCVFARACLYVCVCVSEWVSKWVRAGRREVAEHSHLILLHILTFLFYPRPSTSFIARYGVSTIYRLKTGKACSNPSQGIFCVCVFPRLAMKPPPPQFKTLHQIAADS